MRTFSEAWLTISVFTLAIVYGILYEGHWPVVRDYVNILDKKNWDLFGIYALIVWTLSLVMVPALIWLISYAGARLSGIVKSTSDLFFTFSGSLLPLGLMLWVAFVIPMLFANITFILQSVSDPFGWGWDFLGTANIPWHQFVPRLVPWIQSGTILAGVWFSLRNLRKSQVNSNSDSERVLFLITPMGLFLSAVGVAMIFFYTN